MGTKEMVRYVLEHCSQSWENNESKTKGTSETDLYLVIYQATTSAGHSWGFSNTICPPGKPAGRSRQSMMAASLLRQEHKTRTDNNFYSLGAIFCYLSDFLRLELNWGASSRWSSSLFEIRTT